MKRDYLDLVALEALDNDEIPLIYILLNPCHGSGKTLNRARNVDWDTSISVIKYFVGWADRITGPSRLGFFFGDVN